MSMPQDVWLQPNNNLQHTRYPESRPQVGYCPPSTVAIGIIITLGAVFLTLAAHQILPQGVNAISNLGLMGQCIGYSGLGLGVLTTLVGGVKCFLANRSSANRTIIPDSNPDLSQPSEIEAPANRSNTHHTGKKQQSGIPVFIPRKVKRTLDDLFEGVGGVDNIPSFSKVFNGELPSIEDMDAPIMKGWSQNPDNLLELSPFIAIKMRCTSSKELIDEKLGLSPRQQSYTDYSGEKVLILYQYRRDLPLMWDQLRGDIPQVYPSFFDWNFTFSEDGTGPTNSQAKTYPLLKRCIADGRGEDARGIEWEIIGR